MKVYILFHESYKHFIHIEVSFSEFLKEFKAEYKLTQRAVADVLDISERMYVMYEKGNYNGSEKRINKYLKKVNEYRQAPYGLL